MAKQVDGKLVLIIFLSVVATKMYISNKKSIDSYKEMIELENYINWQNWGSGYRKKILSKETTCRELLKMTSEIEDLHYENLAPPDYNEVWLYIYNQEKIRGCY